MNPSNRPQSASPKAVLAGKYRVERKLGAGGMGMVIEATHLLLSERVAVKLLLPHALEDSAHRARFFREARAAARINSPHVAKVLDMGELDTTEPYIVMEFLDGTNLEALLGAKGQFGVSETASLMLQACEGLAAAHVAGVIHRDIKASNLFLCRAPDGSPLLKIVDFGISKLSFGDSAGDLMLTTSQMSMGSPLTMAPEQMRSARDVDHRADLWSLGTVLYRCLCGKHPFEANTLPRLCSMVMDANVFPLAQRVPTLPAELVNVVNKCLRKSAEDRYQDAAELARALAPFAGEGGAAAAERCQRILEQGRSLRSAPPSAPETPIESISRMMADSPMSSDVSGSTGPKASTSDASGEAIASNTDTSFGRTQRRTIPPRSRLGLLIGGLLLVITAVTVGTLWLRRNAAFETRPATSSVLEPERNAAKVHTSISAIPADAGKLEPRAH